MGIVHDNEPSFQAKIVLTALNKAVNNALDKKEKLGQYAVMWDGEKPVKTTVPKNL